jgi:uncharacterized phiE125 gp8 family phage protein
MPTKIITQPSTEPITSAEVIEYLRLDDSPTDIDLVNSLITAARQYLEQYINRPIATQTLETSFDQFQAEFVLTSPVQSVSSIKYLDENGAEQTLNSNQYLVDTYSDPVRITPNINVSYPTTYQVPNAVKIRYVAGYTTGNSPDSQPMPKPLKFAMLLVIGDLYANREGQGDKAYNVNPAVSNLLSFYRIKMGL